MTTSDIENTYAEITAGLDCPDVMDMTDESFSIMCNGLRIDPVKAAMSPNVYRILDDGGKPTGWLRVVKPK